MNDHLLLSDHLLEALAALNRARESAQFEEVNMRSTVIRELTSAEVSIARVLHLIAGGPTG